MIEFDVYNEFQLEFRVSIEMPLKIENDFKVSFKVKYNSDAKLQTNPFDCL